MTVSTSLYAGELCEQFVLCLSKPILICFEICLSHAEANYGGATWPKHSDINKLNYDINSCTMVLNMS